MRKKIPKILLISCSTLILGIVAFGVTAFYQYRINELTPIDEIPITLTATSVLEETFDIPRSDTYFIWLVFDDESKTNELACKVGMDPDFLDCTNIEPLINVAWEVTLNNQVIGSGLSTGYSLGDAGSYLQKTITQLKLEKNSNYKLKVIVNSDASELNILNPKIKLGIHPTNLKGELTVGAIFLLTSFLFLSFSIILFILHLLLRLRKR